MKPERGTLTKAQPWGCWFVPASKLKCWFDSIAPAACVSRAIHQCWLSYQRMRGTVVAGSALSSAPRSFPPTSLCTLVTHPPTCDCVNLHPSERKISFPLRSHLVVHCWVRLPSVTSPASSYGMLPQSQLSAVVSACFRYAEMIVTFLPLSCRLRCQNLWVPKTRWSRCVASVNSPRCSPGGGGGLLLQKVVWGSLILRPACSCHSLLIIWHCWHLTLVVTGLVTFRRSFWVAVFTSWRSAELVLLLPLCPASPLKRLL